jgi:hypothetical protein
MMRFVLIVWLGFFSCVALAQEEPQKKTKEELQQIFIDAEAAFQAKQYQKALDGYQLLYQETKQSDMLFNVAQCQRFLNSYTSSTKSYQTYLNDQPASPKRNAIEEVVTEMQEKLKKQAEERKKAKRRNAALSGGFLLAGAASGAASLRITQQAKEQGNFPPGKRTEALVLGAVADASLLTSGVFLFFVIRPKKPTYTLELSVSPGQTQVALRF